MKDSSTVRKYCHESQWIYFNHLIPEEVLANLGLATAAKARKNIWGFVPSHLFETLKRVLICSWYFNILETSSLIYPSQLLLLESVFILSVMGHNKENTAIFLNIEPKPNNSIYRFSSWKRHFHGKMHTHIFLSFNIGNCTVFVFSLWKNELNNTMTFHLDLLLGSHIFNKGSKLAKLRSCVMLNRLN